MSHPAHRLSAGRVTICPPRRPAEAIPGQRGAKGEPRGANGRRRLRNPAAIIVDYDSRERGYLQWQDEKSSKMDGNGPA
jgi:hypothetical protein